jgi:hypothetical protein
MSPMSQRSTKRFSDAEQAAMRERAEEQKAAAGRGAGAEGRRRERRADDLTSDDESRIVALIKKAAS